MFGIGRLHDGIQIELSGDLSYNLMSISVKIILLWKLFWFDDALECVLFSHHMTKTTGVDICVFLSVPFKIIIIIFTFICWINVQHFFTVLCKKQNICSYIYIANIYAKNISEIISTKCYQKFSSITFCIMMSISCTMDFRDVKIKYDKKVMFMKLKKLLIMQYWLLKFA